VSEQHTAVAVGPPARQRPAPTVRSGPELVSDVEGNHFALRAFGKAAQTARDEAEQQRRLR